VIQEKNVESLSKGLSIEAHAHRRLSQSPIMHRPATLMRRSIFPVSEAPLYSDGVHTARKFLVP
jgi:uncharacterized NAD-dependent epimerase/dehydratase family protein